MNRLILFLVLLTLTSTGCESSNSTADSGTLRGNIFDSKTNQKLGNVRVSVEGTTQSLTTSTDGEFSFTGLNPGNVVIQYNKDNFGVGKTGLIRIASGDNSYIPLPLEPLAGTWTFQGQWDAGGPPFNSTLTLKNDLSFTSTSATGGWSLAGAKMSMTNSSGTEYTGTAVSSKSISGTMVDIRGYTGNWSASR
jgi:hypothetical protein